LTAIERRKPVADQRDVVVQDPLVEGVVDEHPLMAVRRAPWKGERAPDRESLQRHVVSEVEVDERERE
jgi:hypothetical protein